MKKRAENEVNAMKVGLSLNDNQAVLLGTVLQQFYSQMSRIHMVNNSAGARKRYMQEVYQEREKRIFEILDDAQRSSYLRHMEMRKARVVNDSATKHIRKSFITD
ncbi:hypothetical protein [Chitinophaga rhizosphaerae]|uniref:hypothetical protein n=1 Tax=Chitinophaga rhizosphaerae TaxID=1864947 RepID=UPI0013E08B3C|nr:hypothetical protein [Chitinophaga rhizosphaerae]